MAKNLKELNKGIRAAKAAKKKTKRKVTPKPTAPPAIDFSPLVEALRGMQQPVVNIEQREPVAYNVTVNLNSRGDMVGAKIEPMRK